MTPQWPHDPEALEAPTIASPARALQNLMTSQQKKAKSLQDASHATILLVTLEAWTPNNISPLPNPHVVAASELVPPACTDHSRAARQDSMNVSSLATSHKKIPAPIQQMNDMYYTISKKVDKSKKLVVNLQVQQDKFNIHVPRWWRWRY